MLLSIIKLLDHIYITRAKGPQLSAGARKNQLHGAESFSLVYVKHCNNHGCHLGHSIFYHILQDSNMEDTFNPVCAIILSENAHNTINIVHAGQLTDLAITF
jgi:hypothetical protein